MKMLSLLIIQLTPYDAFDIWGGVFVLVVGLFVIFYLIYRIRKGGS